MWTTIGNSLHWSMCIPPVLEDRSAMAQAKGRKKPLAHLEQGYQAPLVWAKGIRGLSAMWCLLHKLQVAGTDCCGHLRGRREAWLDTTGGL